MARHRRCDGRLGSVSLFPHKGELVLLCAWRRLLEAGIRRLLAGRVLAELTDHNVGLLLFAVIWRQH